MPIQTKITIPQSFFEDIADDLNEEISDALTISEDQIKAKTGRLIKSFLEKHPVYQGLVGNYQGDESGLDLQAEFGLTDSVAVSALRELILLIQDSITVQVYSRKKAKKIEIALVIDLDDDYKNKVNGSPFEYDSVSKSGKTTTIHWMRFLLDAANSFIEDYIAGVQDYGIIFEASNTSRSGRAVMTKDESNAVDERFPYILNKQLISFDGEDFVQETFNNPNFQQLVYTLIESALDEIGE